MRVLPEISTGHCLLNRILEADLPALNEIFYDAQTKRFLPELYPIADSAEGVRMFVSTFDLYLDMGEGFLWGIRRDDRLAGFIAVMDISDAPTVFYAMHPSFRSCGYMKESLSGVLEHLESQNAVEIIFTEVYKENSRSITLLRGLGFLIGREDDEKVYMSKTLFCEGGRTG